MTGQKESNLENGPSSEQLNKASSGKKKKKKKKTP